MSRMYENANARPKEIEEYPPILQARHIQELLNVCEAVAYQILHIQDCPTIRMGKRMVVPRDDFWQFLMAHKGVNEVIRVQKRPNNFVMMDKSFLEDTRLSYKAKGILAYLLSKPDNWKVIVGNLVNYSTDGKASVYAGLKELKECGYYEKVPVRNEQGTRITRWESTVYEIPLSLLTDFQEIENLEIGNQFIENRERNNNYITNKLNINNSHVQSCQPREDGKTELSATLSVIWENVDYASLQITHADDLELIDEFISVILDALLSEGGSFRINGETKPRELVKSTLMKLTNADIIYVLQQFKEHGERVKKKTQYILSMLYHAPMERKAHYMNWVQADRRCIDEE